MSRFSKIKKSNRPINMQQPGQPQQQQIKVPLDQLSDIVCLVCGGDKWVQAFAIKKLSVLYSPDGKEGSIQAPMGWLCIECGKINEFEERQPIKKDENGGNGDEVPGGEKGAEGEVVS